MGTTAILILADAGVAGTAAWAAAVLIAIGMMAFIAGYAMHRTRTTIREGRGHAKTTTIIETGEK